MQRPMEAQQQGRWGLEGGDAGGQEELGLMVLTALEAKTQRGEVAKGRQERGTDGRGDKAEAQRGDLSPSPSPTFFLLPHLEAE